MNSTTHLLGKFVSQSSVPGELNATMVNDGDQDKISSSFDKFEQLNTKKDSALKDSLLESCEILAAASNKRKAVDKNRVSGKPNITQFQ